MSENKTTVTTKGMLCAIYGIKEEEIKDVVEKFRAETGDTRTDEELRPFAINTLIYEGRNERQTS